MNATKLLRVSFPQLLLAASLLFLAFPTKAEVEVPDDLRFIFNEWNHMDFH